MLYKKIAKLDLALFVNLNPKKYPFLLESSVNNEQNKYDILFALPKKYLIEKENETFLSQVKELKKIENPYNLPFIGGYFIYLGYELITEIERVLTDIPTNTLPKAYLVEIGSAIINNHQTGECFIVSDNKDDFESIFKDINDLGRLNIKNIPAKIIEDNEDEFINAVDKCREYIKAGDIFQANLSRKWQIELDSEISAVDIYHKLRATNPSPFSAITNFAGFNIISSSPERLFSVSGNIIQTRPIAGTRPRGDKTNDNKLKSELKQNLKEQAEHLMLLDLERNDLGRIAEFGSVEVDEIMSIESYQFVHHIVSNIKAKLKKNVSFIDIIKAIFPGGTITGCPKIRSMQIIAELEKKPRDAYTGSIGYISKCGNMDFNILIRTIIKQQNNITVSAGAGIVYDSDPIRELNETKHKAEGMLRVFN